MMVKIKSRLRQLKEWFSQNWNESIAVTPSASDFHAVSNGASSSASADARNGNPLVAPIKASSPHLNPRAEPVDTAYGTITIDSDGQFIVTNPEGLSPRAVEPDRYAVLVVADDEAAVLVDVNGILRRGEIVVAAGDRISVTWPDHLPIASFNVSLNDSETEALLTVDYVPGESFRLIPQGPTGRLVLSWQSEPVPPPIVLASDVVREMDRLGIVHGRVCDDVLAEFLSGGCSGTLVVARTYSGNQTDGSPYRQRPLPLTSHRRDPIGLVPEWVEAGTIVGWLDPSWPKRPETVTGRLLSFDPWHLGPGITLMEGDRHLVAERSGRLEWTAWGVRIFPELRVKGSGLAMARPVLVFEGDVFVDGSLEGATIIAEGQVMVTGQVVSSEIHAGRSVVVLGDTLSSFISAGSVRQTRIRLRGQWQELAESVLLLVELFHQCQQAVQGQDRSLPHDLLKRLLDYKFPDLTRSAERLLQIEESPLGWASDPQVREILGELVHYLSSDLLLTMTAVSALARLAEQALTAAKDRDQGRCLAPAMPTYCHLSRVQDSMVYVAGSAQMDDVHNSKMDVVDSLTVRDNLRGGQYRVGRKIEAGALGSRLGEETVVQVEPTTSLIAATTFPGVIVRNDAVESPNPSLSEEVDIRLNQGKTLGNPPRVEIKIDSKFLGSVAIGSRS